jgi:hypothetical protein
MLGGRRLQVGGRLVYGTEEMIDWTWQVVGLLGQG